MSEDDVIMFNKKIWEGGLNKKLVENSDEEQVILFCKDFDISNTNILDIGCATGSIAAVLAEQAGKTRIWRSYTGIDIYEEYLDKFKERQIPKSETKLGNATKLPVANSSKDLILFLFILQHLSKAEGYTALRELRRVARPDAHVLVAATVHPTRPTEEWIYAPDAAKAVGAPEIPTTTWNRDHLVRVMGADDLFCDVVKQEVEANHGLIKLYLRARVVGQ